MRLLILVACAFSLHSWTEATQLPDFLPDQVVIDPDVDPGVDGLGDDVFLDGDWLYVRNRSDDNPTSPREGSVLVYRRQRDGWVYTERLFAPRPDLWVGNNFIGSNILFHEGQVVLTALSYDWQSANSNEGAIFVFDRTESGHQIAQSILDFPGQTLTSTLGFGAAIYEGDLYVTARSNQINGEPRGAWVRYSKIQGEWVHQETFQFTGPDDVRVGDYIQFDQDRMLIAAGLSVVRAYRQINGSWIEIQRFQSAIRNSGRACVVNDDGWVIVGDSAPTPSGTPGAVRIHRWNGTSYEFHSSLVAFDAVSGVGDLFGDSLSRSGNWLAVGAPSARKNGVASGGAGYLFELVQDTWEARGRISTAESGSVVPFNAGTSIAIQDDTVVLGAPDSVVNGVIQVGAAYSFDRPFGDTVCEGVPNSTGSQGQLSVKGNRTAGAGAVRFETQGLPPNSFALFFAGRTEGFVSMPAGSVGNLCIAGSIGRFGAAQASPGGASRFLLDTTRIPDEIGGGIQSGDTFVFQAWYRDVGTVATSNFTSAVSVTFR